MEHIQRRIKRKKMSIFCQKWVRCTVLMLSDLPKVLKLSRDWHQSVRPLFLPSGKMCLFICNHNQLRRLLSKQALTGVFGSFRNMKRISRAWVLPELSSLHPLPGTMGLSWMSKRKTRDLRRSFKISSTPSHLCRLFVPSPSSAGILLSFEIS